MAMDDAAVAVGVGAGADGGAGDAGGFEGGGESVEPEIPAGDEGTDAGSEGSETDAGAEAQEFEVDENGEAKLDAEGNPVPKQAPTSDFKTTHAKLKAVDPKAAEAYRKTHFGYQQYQKAFETPQAAMEAKELFETYGGAEGVEEISTRAEQFAQEMDSFSKGDPNFLSQLAKDDPEGFAKNASPYLAELSKNPDAYNAALTPILNATLEQSGITPSIIEAGNLIDTIYGELKAAGNTAQLPALQQAFNALKKAFGVTENFKKLAEKSGERPLTDREKQLQQKEQQLTQKEQDAYLGEVQKGVTASSDSAINKALTPFFKQVPGLTKDQKADLHAGVFDYIAAQLKSNTKYGKQLRTLLDAGDQAKVVNFVTQNVQKLLQNGAAKTIWNRRGFGKLPNAPAAKTGTTGTVNLSTKPRYDDIDFTKTSEIEYMSGQAVLKGSGKRVKWSWDKV